MTRFRGQRCVQRNEIGARKQIVDVINQLDLQTAGARRGKIGIVSDDPHPESDCAPAQFAADATHSDNAECLVVELDTFEILFVPMFAANVCVGLRNLAGDREQERKCMLSCGNSVSSRRIQYDDAAARGGLDIDIVHAHPGAADHAKLRSGSQDIRGHFRLAAHNQRAELRDQIDKFTITQAGFDHNLKRAIARKLINAALGNGVGDQNLRRSHGI